MRISSQYEHNPAHYSFSRTSGLPRDTFQESSKWGDCLYVGLWVAIGTAAWMFQQWVG